MLLIIVIRLFVELLEAFDNAQNEYETALLFCLLIALLAIEFVVFVLLHPEFREVERKVSAAKGTPICHITMSHIYI